MLKLFFDLKHQNITLTNPGVTVASDSKNYLVAKFNTISDDWETPLSAIFVSTVDKIAYTVLVGQSSNLEPDECFVPWEVLKDSGDVYVSVFSGNLHTTNTAKFAVVKSGYIEGEIPPPPTPTVYEQILEELENKQDVIHLDNVIDEVYNPNGHYVLYYFDTQEIRHNIFDFEVFQELAEEKIYEILDYTLQGDPNIAPSLYIEANQGGSYSLVYMDSDDQKHVIFDFSNLPLGTSDYDNLTNKPSISGIDLIGDIQLSNAFQYRLISDYRYLDINSEQLLNNLSSISDNIHNSGSLFGFQNPLWTWYWLPNSDKGVVFQFRNDYWFTDEQDNYRTQILQHKIFFDTESGEIYLKLDSKVDNEETNFGQWVKIGGGSQIVSGVVNQNGTITFTDSDGGTFNTSGNNIVTSGDQQISMGFDNNGKFYFRFDDGQGE